MRSGGIPAFEFRESPSSFSDAVMVRYTAMTMPDLIGASRAPAAVTRRWQIPA